MDDLSRSIPGWTQAYSGKVRDVYVPANASAGSAPGTYLMVASDRLSAYDQVLPTQIPDKGKLLTSMSVWWFRQLEDIVPNHLISTDVPEEVAGRAVITRRLQMFPIECVARGYIAGTGLEDYQRTGTLFGAEVEPGLVEASKLAQPVFTPSAKARRLGEHDERITFDEMARLVGQRNAGWLRRLTLDIYHRASQIAAERGIIIADTKVEFGTSLDAGEGDIVLADEVLTPDCSRFWPAEGYEPGTAQPSWDKQLVRDWLASPESGWDPSSGERPPELPADIVAQTRERYISAYERLTGESWAG